jgi:large subunit ribosomal protein L35e
MVKVKSKDLRKKDAEALLKQLEEQKSELAQLRVAKVSGGAPSKISQIRVTRKNIARILTILHQSKRAAKKDEFKDKKYKPTDLRKRLTRAKRRELTKEEAGKLPLRLLKKKLNFPQRKFAVA